MNTRILLAGLAAGTALFLWEGVAHMMTPLGTAGIKSFADEASVVATLRNAVQEGGLYMIPAPRADGAAGPTDTLTGLLIIRRHGNANVTPLQLGIQWLTDVATMIFIGVLVTLLAPSASFGAQWALVTSMAVYAFLRGSLPLWNWYGFPKKMLVAGLVMELVGLAIAGAILPKLLKGKAV